MLPVVLVSERVRLPGSERLVATIKAAGRELVWFDAVTLPPPQVLERVEVFVPPLPHRFGEASHEVFARTPALRFVQLLSVGVDHVLSLVPAGATLCNAGTVRNRSVAELVLGLTLMSQRDLDWHRDRMREGAWERDRVSPGLNRQRVLLVGYGAIGQEIERYLAPTGVRVTAVATTSREPLAPGLARVHAIAELPDILPEFDVVVLIVPLTPESRGLFDARMLARMKAGSLLVNVARGQVVDTDALVAETSSGRLRAALDVVDPEPLPAGHPLRNTPGVIVTAHVGGNTGYGDELETQLVGAQLLRYFSGADLDHVIPTPLRK